MIKCETCGRTEQQTKRAAKLPFPKRGLRFMGRCNKCGKFYCMPEHGMKHLADGHCGHENS